MSGELRGRQSLLCISLLVPPPPQFRKQKPALKLTGDAFKVSDGDQVRADVLVSVDRLGEQEMQIVQRQGGDEGQHAVLMRDLHRDVDPGTNIKHQPG